MSKAVIAPDSFKGSATSIEVAAAIAGWQSVRPSDELIQIPLPMGRRHTASTKSTTKRAPHHCPDISPDAYWLLLDDATAAVTAISI